MLKRSIVVLLVVLAIPLAQTSPLVAGECGDVNNDGQVDISDLTYFVDYMFQSGPPPDCSETGTVTDFDGNVYQTIKICDQWWMVENLKVTHYRNGDAIPHVTSGETWGGLSTGAYCEYNNLPSNATTYGYLYNWYAVDDSRNIAPEGWHVPTDEEWKQLEMCLGMSQTQADGTGDRGTDEGGKLKEIGTTHWYDPNTGATNESGFLALPGGLRTFLAGNFEHLKTAAYHWSSTEYGGDYAWYRHLAYTHADIDRNTNYQRQGFSVRCVRD